MARAILALPVRLAGLKLGGYRVDTWVYANHLFAMTPPYAHLRPRLHLVAPRPEHSSAAPTAPLPSKLSALRQRIDHGDYPLQALALAQHLCDLEHCLAIPPPFAPQAKVH